MIDPATAAPLEVATANLITEVVIAILGLLSLVFTTLIAYVGRSFRAWLDERGKEAKSNANAAEVQAAVAAFKSASEKMELLTGNAVEEVENTLVRQFKAERNWNTNTAKRARDTAVEITLRHLGDGGMSRLQEDLGHAKPVIVGMLRTWVERHVRRMGVSGKPIGTPASPIVPMETPDQSE